MDPGCIWVLLIAPLDRPNLLQVPGVGSTFLNCGWEVGGKMSSLGGKEGLDSRWPGHDALTKIERVEASGTRVGPFFRNSDPKKIASSSV